MGRPLIYSMWDGGTRHQFEREVAEEDMALRSTGCQYPSRFCMITFVNVPL
jgi:hypothetical protein